MKEQSILVVDDVPDNIDILVGILGDSYKVKAANNGQQALKIAQSSSPPDLILLDVMMPDMDGHTVCKELKANKATADIPVIFLTALTDPQDEALGFELGGADYITKPVRAPIVLARVRNQLELRESQLRLYGLSTKLARYLSPQIYQSIFAGTLDSKLETRRRKLTIFFSDIVGFTALSENLEPEDLTYLLNTYLKEMALIAVKHGGTLDKFIGDAVMVFFGDPETRGIEEDALACIAMALEMQDAIRELAKKSIKRGIRRPLAVRMGISTGYCTVGNFGSDERMDYTIIGRHVNLAARLESAAEPGQIFISKETWSLVNSGVNCIQKEPVIAKGFAEPIDTYQVIGIRGTGTDMEKIELQYPGFKLQLNPMEVSGENREWVIHSLREALSSLNDDTKEED